ncbi:hypothetical protein MNB_SM-4-633 [hydrothermal vent metagenome]|uniref:Type II secretion envelope pseudopilin protein (PulG,guides folded protein to PulD in outer membrane) n=1 Tax=hydrothermal vent metagenome TaxID=652676 RepID=A0A1W1B9I5_9ZZZZ
MKRAGFTMIELIFVIVILGILSAVALPKFIGVADQAKVGKLQSYVGTLNRTVLPPYWSDSVMSGNSGVIGTAFYNTKINADLTPPDSISAVFTGKMNSPAIDFSATAAAPTNVVATKVYNGVTYSVVCNEGNATSSAICDLHNGATTKYMLYNNL